MKTNTLLALVAIMTVSATAALADEASDKAAVAKQIGSAKITLQQGLAAGEAQGQPISGKFEVDEGKFQLSVYTSKGTAFQEVIVDHTTGKIAKAEPLSEADDIAAGKKQLSAMAKATTTLKDAVDKAEKQTPGFRAVGVEPKSKANHSVAVVTLVKGAEFKSVSEPLE
jgi:Peptidase propeptide and YPEB domain